SGVGVRRSGFGVLVPRVLEVLAAKVLDVLVLRVLVLGVLVLLGHVLTLHAEPLRAQTTTREAMARAPIDAFFKAFNGRDNEALKKTLHYPHVRINEQGGVNVWQTAAEAGTNFDGLARAEGWARSSLDS